MFPNLTTRDRQPEIMDQPDLDPTRFIGSLVGLRRINGVTGSARILWPDLVEAARLKSPETLKVLDVACGGGDIVVTLSRKAKKAGLPIAFTGCDINPLAVEQARKHAESSRVGAEFYTMDATADALPNDSDVIMCSFFLHHLPDPEAVVFLRRAAASAQDRLLIHDLVRARAGYVLAKVGTAALLCNDVCRIDGPRSVQGAFTCPEAEALSDAAGLDGAVIVPRFPYRYLLRWVRAR